MLCWCCGERVAVVGVVVVVVVDVGVAATVVVVVVVVCLGVVDVGVSAAAAAASAVVRAVVVADACRSRFCSDCLRQLRTCCVGLYARWCCRLCCLLW